MAGSLVRYGALIGALTLFETGAALAQTTPACSSFSNVIYVQAGDTQEPLLKRIGRQLRDNTPNPVTLVYKLSGSCQNIDAVYDGVKITTNMSYVPSVAEDGAWTPSAASLPCTIPGGGVDVDLGVSATFVDSCNPNPPPAGIKLFTGPLQAYLFVVPEGSSQKAITAEEGYFAFGFGANGQVTPWDDPTQMFIRATTKSTLLTLAAAIGLPANKVLGTVEPASTDVLNAVSTSTSPKAIGLIGAEIYDAHRGELDALAFRAFKQRHAYYPDSTFQAFDKKNVRDGHYVPWSPTVYIAHVDGGGVVTNPRVKYVVDAITAGEATPTPNFDPLKTVIQANVIPECAMKVTRSFEGGDLSLYSPAEPCGCFYESNVGPTPTTPSYCKACSGDGDCTGGKCRFGYCEAK